MKAKYFFMPDRWRSYFIYLLQTLLKKLDGSSWAPEQHVVEQLMYRYIECSDCVEAGKCIHSDCECLMPERANVKTDICPTKPPKWGPVLDKKLWNDYKISEGIYFNLIKNNKHG